MDLTGPLGPASWNNVSILPFFNNADGMVIDFSSTVAGVSIEFGDYNQDDDTVTLTAYSGAGGTGSVLGTITVNYAGVTSIGNGDSDVGTISLSVAGINSVVVTSGDDFPGSIYYDNLRVETSAVPEPASMTLLAIGAVSALGVGYRRRTRAAAAE